MNPTMNAWWRDSLERLAWTFVEGALGVLTAHNFGWIELSDGQLWKAAAVGGTMAALSFVKSMTATRLSRGNTAQLGVATYSYTEPGPGSAG